MLMDGFNEYFLHYIITLIYRKILEYENTFIIIYIILSIINQLNFLYRLGKIHSYSIFIRNNKH